jgi:hypothetical protein
VHLVSYSVFMSEIAYQLRRKFFASIGVSYITGDRYIQLGVLIPDAYHEANGKTHPLFDASKREHHIECVEKYRAKVKAARMNEIEA